MKTINDNELDLLFEQSAQRQKAVELINAQVMKTVRRDMRRKTIRKWVRLLGICFGLPVVTVLYVYLLYSYMPEIPLVAQIVAFALPVGTIALFFGKSLHDFSPSDL